MLDHKLIKENLKYFLPIWQQFFTSYPIYDQLVKSYCRFLEDPSYENKQIFIHSYEVFNHLCFSDPEGEKQKNKQERLVKEKTRNEFLNNLLKDDLNVILHQ